MTTRKKKARTVKPVRAWALQWNTDFNQSLLLFRREKGVDVPMLWPSRRALLMDWCNPHLTKIVRVEIRVIGRKESAK